MPFRNTLIIFALEAESQHLFQDMNVVYTGVGKVNATYRLTRALADWRKDRGGLPDLVLNLGCAGSHHFPRSSVINCTDFIQRDFDTTAMGHAPFQTPYEDTPIILTNGLRFDGFAQGVCGTGDSFVTERGDHPWNVVEMEAYALAKVCLFEKVPFGCLKFISDGADDGAPESFEEMLHHAAEALHAGAMQVSG